MLRDLASCDPDSPRSKGGEGTGEDLMGWSPLCSPVGAPSARGYSTGAVHSIIFFVAPPTILQAAAGGLKDSHSRGDWGV